MNAPHPLLVTLNRFGLGGRGPTSLYLGNKAVDPKTYLKAEIEAGVRPLSSSGLSTSSELLQHLYAAAEESRQMRLAQKEAPQSQPPPEGSPATSPPPKPAPFPDAELIRNVFRAESEARIRAAAEPAVGIVEHLVSFWSNHFAISAAKGGPDRLLAGAFEREAIRPHVLGRFSDMVRAVEQHPAMLFYLDNQLSIGPNSKAGAHNPKRGLNENLARETMELHTLGVNGGYTQTDVTSLAKILTGWTYAGREGKLGTPGTFAFAPQWHEPGDQHLLGTSFPDTGRAQGETALDFLANRPATAQFIASTLR